MSDELTPKEKKPIEEARKGLSAIGDVYRHILDDPDLKHQVCGRSLMRQAYMEDFLYTPEPAAKPAKEVEGYKPRIVRTASEEYAMRCAEQALKRLERLKLEDENDLNSDT